MGMSRDDEIRSQLRAHALFGALLALASRPVVQRWPLRFAVDIGRLASKGYKLAAPAARPVRPEPVDARAGQPDHIRNDPDPARRRRNRNRFRARTAA